MSAYDPLFQQTEQKYGLPPGILAATAAVESSNNPRAVSSQGAEGLMQLLPSTAQNLHANPLDPAQAVDAAGRLWHQNLQASGGDIDRAAMMYHGGSDTRQWGPKTHAYPQKLAAALGQAPAQSAQPEGGDPIEAALSGQPTPAQPQAQSAPQQSASADPHDPIENALATGNAQPNAPAQGDVNTAMKRMYQSGAKTQDIVAYGVAHGLTPNADQIDQARKQGFGTVNFQYHDGDQQPQQSQSDQGLGFLEGVTKPIDNAATWLKEGADKLGIGHAIDGLGTSLGLPSLSQANANQQSYFKGQEAQGKTPGGLGEFAGSVAGTIPAMIATKNPWIGGGLSGALETDDPNDLGKTATSAGIAAVGGKVAHTLASGAAGLIAPVVSKSVQALGDMGVQMTPGQIMGGALRRIEDGVTSIPLLGDLVKNAQRRSVLSLNTSAINGVLSPLKKSLPNGLVGREAVDYADKAVSNAYNELLPNLKVNVDKPFIDSMGQILKNAEELPADRAAQVQKIIRGNFLDQFNRPGLDMPGETFKSVDAKLGQLGRDYGSSADPEQRQMGSLFRDAQGELRSLLSRSNPDHAEQLAAINQAHANLIRVEGAAGSAGAKGGVFSPAQLASAVKRYDSSARDKAYATGRALLQNISDPANEVLPQTLPDSGTPYRTLGAYLLGGGATKLSPFAAPIAAPLGLYTKAGQKAFQQIMLAPRTPAERALAKALTQLKAPLTVAGGAATSQAAHGF